MNGILGEAINEILEVFEIRFSRPPIPLISSQNPVNFVKKMPYNGHTPYENQYPASFTYS